MEDIYEIAYSDYSATPYIRRVVVGSLEYYIKKLSKLKQGNI